ncbi:hypothetical protein [Halomonas sp. MS1]|nr:hypothetical protein [Halomonas sp. MS1]UTD54919.1 hypothetical protein NF683_17495 [Halomonas sp. MS1]
MSEKGADRAGMLLAVGGLLLGVAAVIAAGAALAHALLEFAVKLRRSVKTIAAIWGYQPQVEVLQFNKQLINWHLTRTLNKSSECPWRARQGFLLSDR